MINNCSIEANYMFYQKVHAYHTTFFQANTLCSEKQLKREPLIFGIQILSFFATQIYKNFTKCAP